MSRKAALAAGACRLAALAQSRPSAVAAVWCREYIEFVGRQFETSGTLH